MSWVLFAALLYPSVVKTDANLFDAGKWHRRVDVPKEDICRWDTSKGGPFSAEEPVWKVSTLEPMSCFWRQNVSLKTGRRYLVGAWVRRDKARAMLWCFSRTKSDKPYDRRVYLFGGFNSCLEGYLRPQIKRRLSGDGDKWQLLYRPIEVPEELAGAVQFKFGVFMSVGTVEFAHPFLVDITEKGRVSLLAELNGGRAASRMSIEDVGTRDLRWKKDFPAPVAEYGEVVELTDALRGFDNVKRVDGSMLTVTYADGTAENVYAPQEGAFLAR